MRHLLATVNSLRASPAIKIYAIPSMVAVILYSGIMLFGLDGSGLSLLSGVVWGLVLLICLWAYKSGSLFEEVSFRWIFSLFVILIMYQGGAVVFGTPEALQPYWHWVGGGAGTLDRSATLIQLSRLLTLAAIFFVGLYIGRSDQRSAFIMKVLIGLGGAYAVYSIILFWVAPGHVLGLSFDFSKERLTGSFLSANVTAQAFSIIAMLNFSNFDYRFFQAKFSNAGILKFATWFGCSAAAIAAMALTASRFGVFSFIVSLILIIILSTCIRKGDEIASKDRVKFYSAFVIISSAIVLSAQILFSRLSFLDGNWNGRKALLSAHWSAFLHSPVTGFGLGSFNVVNKLYSNEKSFGDLWYVNATHNVYLQWMEETGVFGSALMFSIIALMLIQIFRGYTVRRNARAVMLSVLAASAVILIHGFADFGLQTPAIAQYWALLLGVGYSAAIGGRFADQRAGRAEVVWKKAVSVWAPRAAAGEATITALGLLWGLSSRAAADGYPLALRSAYSQAAIEELSAPFSIARDQRAEILLKKGLSQSPSDPVLWLLETQRLGRSPEGYVAFSRSYTASAIDPPLMKWRAAYAAANWDSLPADLRERVMTEIVAVRGMWGVQAWLDALEAKYRGTAFGAALMLTLSNSDNAGA